MLGDSKRKEVPDIKKEPAADDTKPVKKKRSAEYEAMKAGLKKDADEARKLKKRKYPFMSCPK
jgi:hypothetical protein